MRRGVVIHGPCLGMSLSPLRRMTGNSGIKALSRALKKNQTITNIDVWFTNFDHDGVDACYGGMPPPPPVSAPVRVGVQRPARVCMCGHVCATMRVRSCLKCAWSPSPRCVCARACVHACRRVCVHVCVREYVNVSSHLLSLHCFVKARAREVRGSAKAGVSLRSRIISFLLRTAPRDHQLPTANCQPPPTANCQPPPSANHSSILFL